MQQVLTLAESVWPASRRTDSPAGSVIRSLALVAAFSALIAVAAHIQFRLGFTPVPITAQTFAVLLAGALLGSRLGVATMLLYIGEACAGLPVLAPGSNIACYGYLIGFVAAAGVVGALAERGWDRKPHTTVAIMVLGTTIIYMFGVLWMTPIVGGLGHAFTLGVLPFILGDVIKALAASALLPLGWKLARGTSH